MLQRYRYRIGTSFRARRHERGSALRMAKPGLLAVEVSPIVEQRTAMGRRAGLSRLVDNVCLRARLYGCRAAGRAGQGVAVAGDGL
jgi:hypothetical protein